MNKALLLKLILVELETVHQYAIDAAQRAYDTAVDEENEAENKYDTMGLEASYLAHGQSKRVAECENDLIIFKKLQTIHFSSEMPVNIGALVYFEDEQGCEQGIFLSPVAGGLKMNFNQKEITLVTPSSPIGKALLTCVVGDEIEVAMATEKIYYEITAIF